MPLFPNYSACTWSLTPLSAGPLVGDNYDMDINSLSASTIYEYRAYAVIDGTPYYGNILTGYTEAIPTSIPVVETGLPFLVEQTQMLSKWSSLISDGGAPIAEYGNLYTQIPAYGTDSNLRYENVPINVKKNSAYSAITAGEIFNDTALLTGLTPNTMTYFRAFAKNANGIGYGEIKSAVTLPSDVELYFGSIVTGNIATVAANNLVLQTMTIVFEYHIEATVDNNYDDPGTYPNQARTYLEISLDGGSTWTYIEDITAQCDEPQDSDYQVRNGTHTITNIDATNIGLIKIRGGYDCNNDRNYQSGYFSIKISNTSTIDSGTLIILPAEDEFEEGCNAVPRIF